MRPYAVLQLVVVLYSITLVKCPETLMDSFRSPNGCFHRFKGRNNVGSKTNSGEMEVCAKNILITEAMNYCLL